MFSNEHLDAQKLIEEIAHATNPEAILKNILMGLLTANVLDKKVRLSASVLLDQLGT